MCVFLFVCVSEVGCVSFSVICVNVRLSRAIRVKRYTFFFYKKPVYKNQDPPGPKNSQKLRGLYFSISETFWIGKEKVCQISSKIKKLLRNFWTSKRGKF